MRKKVQIWEVGVAPEILKIKKNLQVWGNREEICDALQKEIRQNEKFAENIEFPELKAHLDKQREQLNKNLAEAVECSKAMEYLVDSLSEDEIMLLRMKFEKGIPTEMICMKMFISRATFFRKQKAAFEKLAKMVFEGEGRWKLVY